MLTFKYFENTPVFSECERFFGKNSTMPLVDDNSVICDTKNSKVVPLENGEVLNNAEKYIKLKTFRCSIISDLRETFRKAAFG